MVKNALKRHIIKDFDFLKNELLGILLFGSHATGRETVRSDIDICLVAPDRIPKDIFDKILESRVTQKYDIKIFETLPLYMKGEVLDSAEVIWTPDPAELSYYFYKYRHILEDQKIAYRKLGIVY